MSKNEGIINKIRKLAGVTKKAEKKNSLGASKISVSEISGPELTSTSNQEQINNAKNISHFKSSPPPTMHDGKRTEKSLRTPHRKAPPPPSDLPPPTSASKISNPTLDRASNQEQINNAKNISHSEFPPPPTNTSKISNPTLDRASNQEQINNAKNISHSEFPPLHFGKRNMAKTVEKQRDAQKKDSGRSV